jgi:hypothetical protein
MLWSDIEVYACVLIKTLGECVVEEPAANIDANDLDLARRRPVQDLPAELIAAVVSRVVLGRRDRIELDVAAFSSAI